jgi:hypothetical protein
MAKAAKKRPAKIAQEQGKNRARKVAPSSLAALEPHKFQPGQSGNPGGRPKGPSLSHRIAAILDQTDVNGLAIPAGQCAADVLALAFVREACEGKFPFAKEIIDRTEGKVPDRLAGHDGGPLLDLSKLDDHDLDALATIYGKLALPGPGGGPGGDPAED